MLVKSVDKSVDRNIVKTSKPYKYGAPDRIPTCGLPLRRRSLYATELRERIIQAKEGIRFSGDFQIYSYENELIIILQE